TASCCKSPSILTGCMAISRRWLWPTVLGGAEPPAAPLDSGLPKPVNAVLVQAALEFSFKPQRMQMRQRLAHCESGLVQVQLAPEHCGQDVGRTAGCRRAGLHHFLKTVPVVLLQLCKARVQPAKRFAVRRQG